MTWRVVMVFALMFSCMLSVDGSPSVYSVWKDVRSSHQSGEHRKELDLVENAWRRSLLVESTEEKVFAALFLAKIAEAHGQWRRCEFAYEAAIRLSKDGDLLYQWMALDLYASYLERAGRFEEAEFMHAADEVVKKNPSFPSIPQY